MTKAASRLLETDDNYPQLLAQLRRFDLRIAAILILKTQWKTLY
jgi:hypothetical protein